MIDNVIRSNSHYLHLNKRNNLSTHIATKAFPNVYICQTTSLANLKTFCVMRELIHVTKGCLCHSVLVNRVCGWEATHLMFSMCVAFSGLSQSFLQQKYLSASKRQPHVIYKIQCIICRQVLILKLFSSRAVVWAAAPFSSIKVWDKEMLLFDM